MDPLPNIPIKFADPCSFCSDQFNIVQYPVFDKNGWSTFIDPLPNLPTKFEDPCSFCSDQIEIKIKSKSKKNKKKKFEKEKNTPVFEEGKMVFIFMDPRQNIPLRVANSGISVGSSKKRK